MKSKKNSVKSENNFLDCFSLKQTKTIQKTTPAGLQVGRRQPVKKMNCYSCKTNKSSKCGPPESFEILNIPGENGSRETKWAFAKALTMFGNLKRFLFM